MFILNIGSNSIRERQSLSLRTLVFALLLCFLATGCDSGKIKVSGKVAFADGSPVTNGQIIFISGIVQGKGDIGEDGSYSISYQKKNDGLPPGEYQVLVAGAFFKPTKLAEPLDEMDAGTRPMIDTLFAETETSPLTCAVPGESYNFTVTPSEWYARETGMPYTAPKK